MSCALGIKCKKMRGHYRMNFGVYNVHLNASWSHIFFLLHGWQIDLVVKVEMVQPSQVMLVYKYKPKFSEVKTSQGQGHTPTLACLC